MGKKEGRKKGQIGRYRELKNRNGLVGDCTDGVNHHVLVSSSTLLAAGDII